MSDRPDPTSTRLPPPSHMRRDGYIDGAASGRVRFPDPLVSGRDPDPAGHEDPNTVRGLLLPRNSGVSTANIVAAYAELDRLPWWSAWTWWWWPLEPAGPVTLVGHCTVGAAMCSLFIDSAESACAVWMSTGNQQELGRIPGILADLMPAVLAGLDRAARGEAP